MIKKVYLTFYLCLLPWFLCPERPAKYVALTFDDLPVNGLGMLSDREQHDYFCRILAVLDKYGIRVLGFANSRKITVKTLPLLDKFTQKGHGLGNHTHSHPDLNRVTVKEYIEDIRRGEVGLAAYMGKVKYFRYPMLHRGNTLEKREMVARFLNDSAYRVMPVSIDNDDYIFNLKYVKAVKAGDPTLAREIGREYIAHMAERSGYFEKMGMKKTGRHIGHILLLHMNYINAYYLEELIRWYRDNGWQVIDPETALEDPVYSRKDEYVGGKGLSYLQRLGPVE